MNGNQDRFARACEKAVPGGRVRGVIGTLSEKTLHAVLKHYFEPDESLHEVRIGSFYADVAGEDGVVEIQTRQFNKLRKKLDSFLEIGPVTVAYPMAAAKWLMWIDGATGEITRRRRSPKTGTVCDAFTELYKIKPYLVHPNLRLCILLIDMEEYRMLDGWSADKKKGSTRYDRIPISLADEIWITHPSHYARLIPESLPEPFTVKEYKAAAKVSQKCAQTALTVLRFVGAVRFVGKRGSQFLYEKMEN